MHFDEQFRTWLESALRTVPVSVRAFAFNLNESSGDQAPFSVEVTGATSFDTDDEDWACDEVWEAMPRSLAIPATFSSRSWETCLENIKALVLKTVQDERAGNILRTREAIAVGFVEGDLVLVWRK